MYRVPAISLLLIVGAILFTTSVADAAPFDEFWTDQNYAPGVDGWISDLTVRTDSLFVCGSFGALGPTNCRAVGLMTRSGNTWQVTSYGDDFTAAWGTIVEYEAKLTVSGGKYNNFGELIYGVYQWNGSLWSSLGDLPGGSSDLALYHGELYSTNGVWDGSEWLQPFSSDYWISQVVVHDGLLYCAGEFRTVNGDSINNIFAWNGSEVIPLAGGFPDRVVDMIVHDGSLVAGSVGGLISRWDGANWQPILNGGRVLYTLGVLAGDIVAGTRWRDAGYEEQHELLRYEAGQWAKIGDVHTVDLATLNNTLCISHNSAVVGGVASPFLTIYEDGTYSSPFPAGKGFENNLRDFTVLGDRLVVGGTNRYGGGIVAEDCLIETESGDGWEPLNVTDLDAPFGIVGFFDVEAVGVDLFAVVIKNNLDLYAPVLVKLDQSDPSEPIWRALGSTYVRPWDKLTAVGGGLYLHREEWRGDIVLVDQNDGTVTAVGNLDVDGYIQSVCDFDGLVVIKGDWTTLNGVPANSILIFDGTNWNDFAPALPGDVTAIGAAAPGFLAAAYTVGSGSRVAISAGGSWQDLGGDFNAAVGNIAYSDGHLIATGKFHQVGPKAIRGVAVWTGISWSPLGSGLTIANGNAGGSANIIPTDHGVFFSGGFSVSGGHPTRGLAHYTGDLNMIPDALSSVTDFPTDSGPAALRSAPNPFNPSTVISWDMAKRGSVRLIVHDVRGHLVRSLFSGVKGPGPVSVFWDGRDATGRESASGLYLVHLEMDGVVSVQKVALVR